MVQYKDLCKVDNGARFHFVDLHIHSYGGSHDVKDASMTSEAIVDAAIAQGLSVIAITDHNSNANVAKALEYSKKYAGQLLFLPGVEVTTANGHLLAYFAPEQADQLQRFLAKIDLVGKMGDDNTHTARSMADTIAVATELGGICIAAHIDRQKTGFDTMAPGFPNWKKDIITSPGLYGLECDAVDSLTWYSVNDDAGALGVERKKLLAARQEIQELVARAHFAHVQGSDSHSMKAFQHKDPKKPWTRIKLAELTFEAFRVALIDPTARVRACGSIPASIPRVRGVALTGGFLNGEVIHFSDNLNCFIGGRGTGKSTAIRAIAYAFGLNEDFESYDNCPDSVTVFCEDENGLLYRYQRNRGGEIDVKAKEDSSISEVPVDSFRIEYFGQGELAEVAKDPLNTPALFQEFLDRHINLRDLQETEEALIASLQENAGRLMPLESSSAGLGAKKKSLAEIEKKLKVAEDGKLREVIGQQSKLASEKTIRESIEVIAAEYKQGYTLSGIQKDFQTILETAGVCTNDESSMKAIVAIKEKIAATNAEIKKKEVELNTLLKASASDLLKFTAELKASHLRMANEVVTKLAALKVSGVATDIPGLETLLKQKTSVAKEIAAVEQRKDELATCREQRKKLREELLVVRIELTNRRKSQLKDINTNLSATIKDYKIFVKYEDAGITDGYESFLQQKLHGSYIQDDTIKSICENTSPSQLADLVLAQNLGEIAAAAKITSEVAQKLVSSLCYWKTIFELQALAKQPKPTITVITKTNPPKTIPVFQLSDGQRHTILLTIAMLAESNVPLIIDQPEDDLDNAFIFSSIVSTLRAIKERRQVILVTHNANIAVLGDSELILPMCRENDYGRAKDRGSIDGSATKLFVQNILEGGPSAFLRRKAIYNH